MAQWKRNKKRHTGKLSARSRPKRRNSPASPSTAIVRVAPPAEKPWELNQEQVALVKNYLHLQDASEIEFKACLEVSRRYRLDPFKKGQIWFVKRWDSGALNASGGTGAYVYTPQLGIYGMAHIAARDHSDYGTFTKPEYGPTITHEVESNHKIKAPEWCRVGLTKKGVSEASVGEAFFEEFCPKKWENAKLFWSVMPHRMIAKCAKAQALREAYPDLGGLYIPEEMDRMKDNYTEGGRQITYQEPSQPSVAQEDIESLRARGLWCDEHGRLRSANHLKTCESSRKAIEAMKKPPQTPQEPRNEPPASKEPPKPAAPATLPQLTLDWQVSEVSPRLTGDSEIIEKLKGDIHASWGKDEFWHVEARDAEAIRRGQATYGYRLVEILPEQDSSSGAKAPRGTTPSPGGDKHGKRSGSSEDSRKASGTSGQSAPAVDWITGIVDQVNPGSGKSPSLNILFAVEPKKKHWLGCFDQALFPFLSKAAGINCQFIVQKRKSEEKTYTNIVGIKRIGNTTFEDDGKTPYLSVNREPGKQGSIWS